jgi:uroporphyrinogen decarboxylase
LESGERNLEAYQLKHRERIEACLSGRKPDRPPVALWRHFPVDDQTPDGLAAATIAFQQTYDFDLVKVTPASSYCLQDWGVEDAWRGAPEGTRDYTHRRIQAPEDWLALEVLDPYRGRLADQLSCLDLVIRAVGESTPVIQTIFSPLAQAKNLVGGQMLLAHLRQFPEAVHAGLQIIVESTQLFIEAALKTGISGIFYAVQHANYHLLSELEYSEFGVEPDLKVLNTVQSLWLNMLHLHGDNLMFDLFRDYPVTVINWHDRDTYPSLSEAVAKTPIVLCGGLQREKTMVLGTPEQVLAEAYDSILATEGKKFILGTGCVLPITAPRANILAARRSVEIIG